MKQTHVEPAGKSKRFPPGLPLVGPRSNLLWSCSPSIKWS